MFILGGILGDHPPRDRTFHLRENLCTQRHLGSIQMSTDTATLVTKLIIENNYNFGDIPFIDEP